MQTRKFFIDWETYYRVREAGHSFTVFQDTPVRFIPIVADGRPVSLPACGSLADAVALALSHCL